MPPWRWQHEPAPADQPQIAGLGQAFPTQADAEAWLGEVYPDLLEAGVQDVTLYEEQRLVYGPMSLLPEDT